MNSSRNPSGELGALQTEYQERRAIGKRLMCGAIALYFVAILLTLPCFLMASLFYTTVTIFDYSPGIWRRLCLAILAASIPWYFARRLQFRSRRFLQKDGRLVLNESSEYVLYLRPFASDETENPEFGAVWAAQNKFTNVPALRFHRVADETMLIGPLRRSVGPVVAIGRPGDALPQLGAHRYQVAGDEWRSEVADLLKEARIVVTRVGETEGVSWELRRVFEDVLPERVVIYLPDPSLVPRIEAAIPGKPRLDEDFCFLTFDDNWTPRPFHTLQGALTSLGVYSPKRGLPGVLERLRPRWTWRFLLGRLWFTAVSAAACVAGIDAIEETLGSSPPSQTAHLINGGAILSFGLLGLFVAACCFDRVFSHVSRSCKYTEHHFDALRLQRLSRDRAGREQSPRT